MIKIPGDLDMSEKRISRRGAFSLLGLATALGFVLPTTVLMTSGAEAQVQPTAPAPAAPAPAAPAPAAPATSGTERRQERRTSRTERRAERRTGRAKRHQARRTGRTERREARGKGDKLYMKGQTTKQK
jgi:hypothetical protein